METTYNVRNDVKSDDVKLMREKGLSWFHRKGWKRECVCKREYVEVYKWTTNKNNVLYTYVVMREVDSDNVFINAEGYNEWVSKDIKLYLILADIRKGISPKWLDIDSIRHIMLRSKIGATRGLLVPDNWFKEFDKIKCE